MSQWPVTHGSFIIIEWTNRVREITLHHFGLFWRKKASSCWKSKRAFFANSIERVAQYSVMYVLMEKLNAQIYSISVHTISREKLHNTV